jgi:DNA-3-methyladenine glycosylase
MSRQRAPLPRAFYDRPTLVVAEALLGKLLVHAPARTTRTAGVIVEVEAYIGETDPACHAAAGPTRRNAPLYGPPGRAYVYLNYGLHALVNAVTEREGQPAAVLIRALDPVEGLDLMRRRRERARGRGRGPTAGRPPLPDWALCRGPGNLAVALGLALGHNGLDLTGRVLRIEDRGIRPDAVAWTPRIGIRVGTRRPWRAVWAGHRALSG